MGRGGAILRRPHRDDLGDGCRFTARARHAMAEIAKADDWGLEARASICRSWRPARHRLPLLPVPRSSSRWPPSSMLAMHAVDVLILRSSAAISTTSRPCAIQGGAGSRGRKRDARQLLRDLHPKHEQFERLRQALLKARGTGSRPEQEIKTIVRVPDGPTLEVGNRHPNVALLRQRLKLAARPGEEDVYDREVQDAVKDSSRRTTFSQPACSPAAPIGAQWR